jgi:hypothetical protein
MTYDYNGGSGIRTHEPLRDGIPHGRNFILSPARLAMLRYPSITLTICYPYFTFTGKNVTIESSPESRKYRNFIIGIRMVIGKWRWKLR